MTGEKPTFRFFLLRGLARESRHWGSFVTKLASSRPNIKVFPLDIPGTGRLNTEYSPTAAADYIPPLRSQYISHSAPGDIHIILGLSFGGMIAAQWIKEHGEDFQATILINTSSRTSPFYKRLLPYSLVTLCKTLFIRTTLEREKIIAKLSCNKADTESVASQWTEIIKDAPISSLNQLRQLYSAASFKFPAKLEIPALLLCSSNDRLVQSSCSQHLHHLLDKPVIYHPTAGHDLTTDDPEWCVSTLLNWLDQTFSSP